jgi:hypothetical protein
MTTKKFGRRLVGGCRFGRSKTQTSTEHTEAQRSQRAARKSVASWEMRMAIAAAVCGGLAHLGVLCVSVCSVVSFERAESEMEALMG